jgi:hypothetical protein
MTYAIGPAIVAAGVNLRPGGNYEPKVLRFWHRAVPSKPLRPRVGDGKRRCALRNGWCFTLSKRLRFRCGGLLCRVAGRCGCENVLPFLGLVFIYVPQPGACVTTQAPGARLGYGRGFLSPAGAEGNRKRPGCSGPVRTPRQGGGRHQTGVSIIALIDALWASACCGTSRT